jgi:hypothetical protein
MSATRPHRWRRLTANVLLGLGCVLAPLALVAVWAEQSVLDTERYVSTVSSLAADPTVQDAAADVITRELFEQTNAAARVAELLPGERGLLAAPIVATLEESTYDIALQVIASERGQQLWIEANRAVHPRLVALLTGEGTAFLSLEGDEVILDLTALLAETRTRLAERGLTIFDRVPSGQVRTVELVIAESEELVRLQRATELLVRLAEVLPILALVALLGSIVVAPKHVWAILRTGLALAVSIAVLLALVAIGRDLYLDGIEPQQRREVAVVFFDTILESLRAAGRILILVGLFVAVLGLLLHWVGGAHRPSGALTRLAGPLQPWLSANRTAVSLGIVAVACALLAILDRPSTAFVVGLALVVAALLIFVQLAGRSQPAPPVPS